MLEKCLTLEVIILFAWGYDPNASRPAVKLEWIMTPQGDPRCVILSLPDSWEDFEPSLCENISVWSRVEEKVREQCSTFHNGGNEVYI